MISPVRRTIVLMSCLAFFPVCSSDSGDSGDSSGGGTSALCDASGITTYSYLIAFHACASDCSDPRNHTIYLAGSNDGNDWTLISEFEGRAGSVPDVAFFDDFLYIFHAGDTSKNWVKVNACFDVVETGKAELTSTTDTGGFVDPSLVVSGEDLLLFYLPGVMGSDPAGCGSESSCTKEIHSAAADDETLARFTQVSGARVSANLNSGETFSDPDLVARSSGPHLLYVSHGQDTYVYTGIDLAGTFSSPDGSTSRKISNGAGGVPSGIEAPGGEIWLYVTTNQSGVEVIRRAVSADGVTALGASDFQTVIDASISAGFAAGTSVSSPSIITWPSSTWSREQAGSSE